MQQLSSVPSSEKKKVKIKNIVAKSAFLQPFSISRFSGLSLDTSNPYQPRVRIAYGNVKFSVLHSWTVIARAASSVSQSMRKLMELAPLLPHSSYDPSPPLFNSTEHHINPFVFYFNADRKLKPRRTALIFHTGNATLTGFFSLYDLLARASQLSSLIAQIAKNHPAILEGE